MKINRDTPLETKVIGLMPHCENSQMVGIIGRIISKTLGDNSLSRISVEFEKDIDGHGGNKPVKYLNIQTIGRTGILGNCWCYNAIDFHKLRILTSESEAEE